MGAMEVGMEGYSRAGAETGSPRLRLGVVLAVILILKAAALASFVAGWYAGPFDERYSGYVYVDTGHKYKQTQKIKKDPLERSALFDGQWYLEIASEGYTLERVDRLGWSSYAFFPAFPVLSALAGMAGVGQLAGGLILNQLLSVLSGILLFVLAKRMTKDPGAALISVLCFYLFPTAGFLNVFYSESLFVFLLLSHVLLFERGNVWGAAIVGVVAGLCRPQGVLLVFWHLGKLAENPRSLRQCSLAALSPVVGFSLFWGYISWRTGSVTSLFELQSTWGRNGDLGSIIHDLGDSAHSFSGWLLIITLVLAGTALVLTKRVTGSAAWTALSLAMIAVPLATGSTTSMARFLIANVPQYVVLGALLRRRPVLQLVVLCGIGCLQGFANVRIVNWKWVG